MSGPIENVSHSANLSSSRFPPGVDVRDPRLTNTSVEILQQAPSYSKAALSMFGNPEMPSSYAGEGFGGRSFSQLMFEVQRALSKMSFDTKIVSREQMVAYGRGKAKTMDDGADKIREGAAVNFATQVVGASISIAANALAIKYARSAKPGDKAAQDMGLEIQQTRNPTMGAEPGVSPGLRGGATNNANAGANRGTGNNRDGTQVAVSDTADGAASDALFVSPMMTAYQQIGTAMSTIIAGAGDMYDKHQQAQKLELDADGSLFDTYAGEQSQFYGDANQNIQRSLSLLGSFIGQIYSTNTSIIANNPR